MQKSQRQKVILLLASLVLTGIVMRLLSPPAKLDVRFYYTVVEAQQFFSHLTSIQAQKYFWGELVDLWFMFNYSWLLFLWAQNVKLRNPSLTWATGWLDLGETALILSYLSGYPVWIEGMRWFSTVKWSAALVTLFTLAFLTFRRKSPTA